MHPDIFICYSGIDTAIVEKIIWQLEHEYGWRCWLAQRDMPTPISYDKGQEMIAEMIEKCSVFLLLSSADTTNSLNVQMAVSQAMAIGVKRVELKVDENINRTLYVLNHRLHGYIRKKGTSYKDADFVDEGFNIANQVGVKALVLLLIVMVVGFIAVRTFDVLSGGGAMVMVESPMQNTRPPSQGEVYTPEPTAYMRALERARRGDVDAKYELGRIYTDLWNFESAVYWYREAAEEGHVEATLELGLLHWYGARTNTSSGFIGDRIEAIMWFYKAAELGNANMQNLMAGFYRTGAHITAQDNDNNALDLAEHLRITVVPRSHTTEDGTVVTENLRMLEIPQDYNLALYWYRRAAQQGHSAAQTTLGVMYIFGQGVTADPEQAVYWNTLAAIQGEAIAQGNLGISYIQGYGVTQCYQQAEHWFRTSAMQDNTHAQINLAWMYETGLIGSPNPEQAFYWSHRAATLGDNTGQINVGLMYMRGHGVGQCYSQAAYWFRQAAETGCAIGREHLSLMYDLGIMPEY